MSDRSNKDCLYLNFLEKENVNTTIDFVEESIKLNKKIGDNKNNLAFISINYPASFLNNLREDQL